jgi:transcriptional regulator with XRE-family HTH domain
MTITAAQYYQDESLEWDLADRLRKALRIGHITAGEMAEYLGVHRVTVSAWMLDRQKPRVGMLRLWAAYCGVPFEWLRDGEESIVADRELARVQDRLQAACAVRDSNPEPADYWLVAA